MGLCTQHQPSGALEQQMTNEAGFTLIEVLMALTVFAMVAGLSYAALGTADKGFAVLHDVRVVQERSGWAGKQLRSDLRYLSAAPMAPPPKAGFKAEADKIVPIRIKNDNRGDIDLDHLWLLVREPGQAGISQVHYFIDENDGHLIRESRSLLARNRVEPIRWDFGKASSWAVEVWDQQANWRQDWNFPAPSFVWPKAVRVTMQVDENPSGSQARSAAELHTYQWMMPVLVGREL